MASRVWFVSQSTAVRVLVSMAVATWGVGFGLGFLILLVMQDDDGSWWALVPGAVFFLGIYAIAIRYALRPHEETRRALRWAGSYPTSAPGCSVLPELREPRSGSDGD